MRFGKRRSKLKTLLEYNMEEILEHSICVSNIAGSIAREMGIDQNGCYEIAIAGMYHDIGKIRLSRYLDGEYSDEMTSEEIKYMRTHSKLSYDIVDELDFSKFITDSILYHHENFNGTGYPDGLSGYDIPLGARILRVSDVYSALISQRAYRQKFDTDTALEIMIEEVEYFDMEVFLAFQKIINNKEIRKIVEGKRLG